MKWANHFETAKHSIATETIIVLAGADVAASLVAARIPIKATEMTLRTTSRALRPLYAALQLGQFTTWDQYLKWVSTRKMKFNISTSWFHNVWILQLQEIALVLSSALYHHEQPCTIAKGVWIWFFFSWIVVLKKYCFIVVFFRKKKKKKLPELQKFLII